LIIYGEYKTTWRLIINRSVSLDADSCWDYIILMTDECIWSNGLLILTQENKSTWRKAIHISHRVQCGIQPGHPQWEASDLMNLTQTKLLTLQCISHQYSANSLCMVALQFYFFN
jgi:hypothetical protein